jgi:type II secretory pathway pseudopilin PulG
MTVSRPTLRIAARRRGTALLETVIVFAIIALLIGLAVLDVVGIIRRSRLDEDVSQFARTMRLAAEHAVFSGKKIAVVIQVTDGDYDVYEENSEGKYDEQSESITQGGRLDLSYIDEIEFEDGTRQYSGEIILHATPKGWGGSVLFSLLDDRNERQRYVQCQRFTTKVIVSNQPLTLPEAREEVSMTSPL